MKMVGKSRELDLILPRLHVFIEAAVVVGVRRHRSRSIGTADESHP